MTFIKKLVVFLLLYSYLFSNVFSSFFIIEIFPNTPDDKNLEFISIYNSWVLENSLSGFYLEDKSEKKYYFWSGEVFGSGETKKYFREKTKIILNNTNEELYLKNNSEGILDNFNYLETVKSHIYSKKFYSDEVKIESRIFSWTLADLLIWWEELTSSWELDWSWCLENTWSVISSWNILEIPDLKIEIQSWLDFLTWSIWKCPEKWDWDCKINLNLENTFTWIYLQEKFDCSWVFWTWAIFSTWTLEKCNPSYVTFWTWEFLIEAKIYEKENISNFKTGSINILNILEENESQEEENSSWKILETINIKPIFGFQSPTYLLEKDLAFWTWEVIYNCDSSKTECKINLDFRNTFTWELNESDFICSLDFWFWTWILTWQENKCNPNSIIIPEWIFDLKYSIINKQNYNFAWTWSFKIINNWYKQKEKISSISSNSWWWNNNSKSKEYIWKIDIEVQSWLDQNNTCEKVISNINFIYDDTDKNVECKWSFTWWDFSDWTEKKCNPWYVKYWPWEYRVKLKVIDKNYPDNYETTDFYFTNIYKKEELNPKIDIQWVQAKYKIRIWNKIICNWVSQCSVNFTWNESNWEIEKYFWDFWNGENYEKSNPTSIKFWLWIHKIIFKIYDKDWNFKESSFEVEVRDNIITEEELKEEKLDNLDGFSLEKNQIILKKKLDYFYQTFFRDSYKRNLFLEEKKDFENIQKTEIQNNFKQTIRKNKNYISIYWKSLSWSKLVIQKSLDYPIFWELFSNYYEVKVDKEWKYKLKLDYNGFWKYRVKNFIFHEKLWIIKVEKIKELIIPQEKIIEKQVLDEIKKQEEYLKLEKKNQKYSDEIKKKKEVEEKQKNEISPKIIVQWKIWKNKILQGNKLTCIDTCSVNFWQEIIEKNIDYFWDFWNWKTFSWANPWYIKYKDFWNYTVFLTKTYDSWKKYTTSFVLEYVKEIKDNENIKDKEIIKDEINKSDESEKITKSEDFKKQNNIYFMIFIIFLLFILGFILLRREKII